MEHNTRRKFIQPPKAKASPRQQRVIDSLRPLQFDGEHELTLRRMQIFSEQGCVVLSLVGDAGTINVPLNASAVAKLACSLTKHLADQRPVNLAPRRLAAEGG